MLLSTSINSMYIYYTVERCFMIELLSCPNSKKWDKKKEQKNGPCVLRKKIPYAPDTSRA